MKALHWLAAALLIVIAARFGFASEAGWKAEWQKAIEGAKKEGHLTLYGGQEISHPEILAAFNKVQEKE